MAAHVLLAMGSEILREGLRRSLQQASGLGSIELAADGVAALRAISEGRPDVAVLDQDLCGVSYIEVIERARANGSTCRCITLVDAPSQQCLERGMRAGAAGIVLATSHARELAEAVRVVLGGCHYVPPGASDLLLAAARRRGAASDGGSLGALTAREREVLRLIAEECSSREIAKRLGISTRTVETHRGRLMKKLDLRRTAALVRFALREGLVGT